MYIYYWKKIKLPGFAIIYSRMNIKLMLIDFLWHQPSILSDKCLIALSVDEEPEKPVFKILELGMQITNNIPYIIL